MSSRKKTMSVGSNEQSPLIPMQNDGLVMNAAEPSSSVRLRGLLKLISNPIHPTALLRRYRFDADKLLHTHGLLLKPRRLQKKKEKSLIHQRPETFSFQELASRHRFVCFFFVQWHPLHHYSQHTLKLRKLLANGYHDSMTTFVIMMGGHDQSETAGARDIGGIENDGNDNAGNGGRRRRDKDEEAMDTPHVDNFFFFHGTGFAVFPSEQNDIVWNMLNISQLPSVIVNDTTTGRIVSADALLAIERNDPHFVINSWQQGKSGLSCLQRLLAAATCEGSCHIQ
jgi:hypothetical protein